MCEVIPITQNQIYHLTTKKAFLMTNLFQSQAQNRLLRQIKYLC